MWGSRGEPGSADLRDNMLVLCITPAASKHAHTHSLFLIIALFPNNVNASMEEVYYGELIKGYEIGAHMCVSLGV